MVEGEESEDEDAEEEPSLLEQIKHCQIIFQLFIWMLWVQ